MIFNLRHIERKSVDKFFETVDVLAVLAFWNSLTEDWETFQTRPEKKKKKKKKIAGNDMCFPVTYYNKCRLEIWSMAGERRVRSNQGDPSGGEPGLGWLRFGEFPRLVAATVDTYCPSSMVEHPKSKSTKPRFATRWLTLYVDTRASLWSRSAYAILARWF